MNADGNPPERVQGECVAHLRLDAIAALILAIPAPALEEMPTRSIPYGAPRVRPSAAGVSVPRATVR